MKDFNHETAQPEPNLYTSIASGSTRHPSAFCSSLQSNTGLVRRLQHLHTYKGHSSAVNALDWSLDGSMLISSGDDCRVKIWSAESSRALQSFDSVQAQWGFISWSYKLGQ